MENIENVEERYNFFNERYNLNKVSIELLEELKKLGSELFLIYVKDSMVKAPMYMFIAGLEKIESMYINSINQIEDTDSAFKDFGRLGVKWCSVDHLGYVNYPYMVPLEPINLDNLKIINKYRSVDSFNKDKVVKFYKDKISFNQEVDDKLKSEIMGLGIAKESSLALSYLPTKQDLIDKHVYLWEHKPTTNSLALANKFGHNHMDVVKKLLSICKDKPSYVNHIRVELYKYKSGGYDHEVVTSYLHIDEAMYLEYIRSMGRAKTRKAEVKRLNILQEYDLAFINLKDRLYKEGIKEEYASMIMTVRKGQTKQLMDIINTYINHGHELSLGDIAKYESEFFTSIFNLINIKSNLNKIGFKSQSKDDREHLTIAGSFNLTNVESEIADIFEEALREWKTNITTKGKTYLNEGLLNLVRHTYKYLFLMKEMVIGKDLPTKDELDRLIIDKLNTYDVGKDYETLLNAFTIEN